VFYPYLLNTTSCKLVLEGSQVWSVKPEGFRLLWLGPELAYFCWNGHKNQTKTKKSTVAWSQFLIVASFAIVLKCRTSCDTHRQTSCLFLYIDLQAWGMCNVYLEPDTILERGLKDLEFEILCQNNNHKF
jgi:hypothetical protein